MAVSSKEMKYKKEIVGIELETKNQCVGTLYEEEDRQAYRWTFKDIEHPNNFLPMAILLSSKYGKDCGGWALSFFTTEELATQRLENICSNKRHLHKKLGTHIAEGKIEKSDGLNGGYHPTNGHFSHYEYKETDFSKKFVVKTLVDK